MDICKNGYHQVLRFHVNGRVYGKMMKTKNADMIRTANAKDMLTAIAYRSNYCAPPPTKKKKERKNNR